MGLFVSPGAIKFTVMWLLMSVFFLSMGKIESTDAAEDTGEEFPLNGTPVVETPSVVTGTPFDFAPLWKLILLRPPPPTPTQPPDITAVLRSVQLYYPEWGFIQRSANQMSAHPRVSSLCFNPVWTFYKGDAKAMCCLSLSQGIPNLMASKGWIAAVELWLYN